MMKNIYFFLILFGFATSYSFSQGNKSLEERKKFINEIGRQISVSGDDEAMEFINIRLQSLLLDGQMFTNDKFELMVKTTNALIANKHRAYPHAYNYIVAFTSFVEKNEPFRKLNQWHSIVDELTEQRNPRKLQEFLETSRYFFSEGIISIDPNYSWYCTSRNYELINDKTIFIKFDKTDLICRTINRGMNKEEVPFSDSVRIIGTEGIADLSKGTWKGNGGFFTWEKVGLPANETNAQLKNYILSFKSTNLTADSVVLKTPYVDEPIMGKLIDRAVKGAAIQNQNKQYPQFTSYQANFEIKDLVGYVDYVGGVSLEANEFVGVGNKGQRAKLTYYLKEKVFITTYSDQVRIKDRILKTPMAQFSVFIGEKDSIFHPGLDITYNINTGLIKFTRGNSPVTQAPFIDSYHKLNLYVEEISYEMDEKELILGFDKNTAEQQRNAGLESFHFYDEKLFQRIQGMASVNPLTALYNYAWKYDKFIMEEGTAATALQSTLQQVKPILLELSTLGFITYDTERGIIKVNEKTENFVKAKSGKIDYDNISFRCELAPVQTDDLKDKNNPELIEKIKKRNLERSKLKEFGTINLESLDLSLNGIDIIPIANSSRTRIYPEDNKVVIKENRKIEFTGWINSGKWEIKINAGNYDYEENKFYIDDSEIAYFYVAPLKKEDGEQFIPLQSSISGINGELLVNDISNRAGIKKDFDNYPVLISKEKSKIFYDYKKLHKGAYEKDRFYFELDPFQIDSLMTFNDKSLSLPGTLVSAGIFPRIQNDIKIMPDYSLGFSKEVPKGGYDFYGTGGKYDNKILLSNNGLQGSGTIKFLNSSSTSKHLFTFLPDSTIGVASFVNKPQEAGVEFPDAEGPDAFITYVPKKQILKARSNQEKIKFFDEEAELNGVAYLTTKGMTGSGILELSTAIMKSDNYQFTRWNAKADTSSFMLSNKYKQSEEDNIFDLKTDNVKSDIDFKERKGVFNSNEGGTIVEFPANLYVCKIQQFTWFMDNDEMLLQEGDVVTNDVTIEGDVNMIEPNFFSIHPKQDSLQFRSPNARFSMKERTIYAFDVKYIDVADARVFPDSSKLIIREKAKMDELKNSVLVVNSITKYHTITNSQVLIAGRKSYTGSGDYQYGRKDGTKQSIRLEEIYLDKSLQTVADGKVDLDDGFRLSRQFDFYGSVHLASDEQFLTFKGATRVNHNCRNLDRNWLAFEAPIDPENIQIPISDNMVDLEGKEISAGIRWRNSINPDSLSLYPTFLSALENEGDQLVISSSGFLQFDTTKLEFQISNKEKLINRNEVGNYISLNTKTCSMTGDGRISLGIDFGTLTTEAVGTINYNREYDRTEMNLTLAVRAPINEKVFERVGDKIAKDPNLQAVDFNSSTLENAIAEWTNQKTADKIKSDYTLKREFKSVPKPMQDAIIITDLKLTSYNKPGEEMKGFISTASKAAIVNIFKEPVMQTVPFKIFVNKQVDDGGRLTFLIEAPRRNEYFFDYNYKKKEGILNIVTNDYDLTNDVSNLKPGDKRARRFLYDVTDKSPFRRSFLRLFFFGDD